MRILDSICNSVVKRTLWIYIYVNIILLSICLIQSWPINVFFFVIMGELLIIVYQIKDAFNLEWLLGHGEKIYYTSGMYYTKAMVPNRVNVAASGMEYTIIIQDDIIKKKFKTKVVVSGTRHCQKFEEILNSRPEIEVIMDNVNQPKKYYINLEELVKYSTCINLGGIYKNRQKLGCLWFFLCNCLIVCLVGYFYIYRGY